MKFAIGVDCEGVACGVGSPGASLNSSRNLEFALLQATREADAAARGIRIAVARPWRLHPDRADPGLCLTLGHVSVTDDAAAAPTVGQIRMGRDMGFDFRLDRLRQQPMRAGA